MKTIFCIGCGCTENHACPPQVVLAHVFDVQDKAGCFWLRFSADDRAGVCSECEDLVKGWDQGQRRPIVELIAERFYRQVMFMYAEAASAVAWMHIPHPVLRGKAPRDCILAGELERVHLAVEQLRSGVCV